MVKFFFGSVLASMLMTSVSHADSIRSECENAHYATGYTLLHKYVVNVNWENISDSNHEKLDNIIFDEAFTVLSENHNSERNVTRYELKENSGHSDYNFDGSLTELNDIPGVKVSCKYDY